MVLVVLLFLRQLRPSLIIAFTIPFSLIIAFIFMYFLGYTINIMTLSSLAIAIGMVVDNAIVVTDNVFRWREKGLSVKEAAIKGTSEVGWPFRLHLHHGNRVFAHGLLKRDHRDNVQTAGDNSNNYPFGFFCLPR